MFSGTKQIKKEFHEEDVGSRVPCIISKKASNPIVNGKLELGQSGPSYLLERQPSSTMQNANEKAKERELIFVQNFAK